KALRTLFNILRVQHSVSAHGDRFTPGNGHNVRLCLTEGIAQAFLLPCQVHLAGQHQVLGWVVGILGKEPNGTRSRYKSDAPICPIKSRSVRLAEMVQKDDSKAQGLGSGTERRKQASHLSVDMRIGATQVGGNRINDDQLHVTYRYDRILQSGYVGCQTKVVEGRITVGLGMTNRLQDVHLIQVRASHPKPWSDGVFLIILRAQNNDASWLAIW